MGTKWWHIVLFVAVILAAAAALHPTRYRVGWMYVRSGMISDALKELARLHEKSPENYRAMRLLAQVEEEEGNVDAARDLYERLIAQKPRDSNFSELARFYTWTFDPLGAKRAYERWYDYRRREGFPFDDEDGRQILESLYASEVLFENYGMAIDVVRTYRETFPTEARSMESDLIDLYEMNGDLHATVAALEEILAQNDDSHYALEKFADLAVLAGKTDVARNYLIRDMERHPGDEVIWHRLVEFEVRTGRKEAAGALYTARLAADPGNAPLEREYVNWLIGTDQQKVAIAYLERQLRNKGADPSWREMLVKLYEWNNMQDKLLPIYLARFDENPSDRENARRLVWMLIDRKQNAEAERVLRRLLELSPRDTEYAGLLADLYDAKSDADAAIDVLERSARASDDPKILKRLGELYLWNAGSRSAAALAPAPGGAKRQGP